MNKGRECVEIIQFEQGFKLHIEINNRASCMSVMGKVFPFEGSPEYIGFWMQDELLPPSEGRHRLYRSHIDFEIRLVNGVEIDQFIKAVNVAKDRLNRYQSLHMR